MMRHAANKLNESRQGLQGSMRSAGILNKAEISWRNNNAGGETRANIPRAPFKTPSLSC
jgi:hypothetical protein